jgi:hypothetical protein
MDIVETGIEIGMRREGGREVGSCGRWRGGGGGEVVGRVAVLTSCIEKNAGWVVCIW